MRYRADGIQPSVKGLLVQHQMSILDRTGDTVITWAPENAAEVAEAADRFVREIGSGAHAYRVTAGEAPVLIQRFDPQAEEIVITAPLIGG